MKTHDPARARRLALLRQVESELEELFAHANSLPEPERTKAREYLRDIFSRAAGTQPWAFRQKAQAAPRSPGLAKPSAPAPESTQRPKGAPCKRCDGSGWWRGWKATAKCFACEGSGIERPRRWTGGAAYGSR
jgi:hypothetical protein